MPKISETASFILTLLNNIDELGKHYDKKSAGEVMEALRIYGKNKDFIKDGDSVSKSIENFFAVLLDARSYTISMIIRDIADEVMMIDMKNKKSQN